MELVIYDATFLNYGEHHQTDTSVFICPVDGLYCFSVNVVSSDAAEMMTGRLMMDQRELTGYQSAFDENASQTASTFGIFECLQGQRVWVRTSGGDTITYTMSGENARSLFSGF